MPTPCLGPPERRHFFSGPGSLKLSCGWEILVKFMETVFFTAGLLTKVHHGRGRVEDKAATNPLDLD